ncbi:MAG: ribonuclease H-like domain-containing protein [Treponema sp.]|jgi:hypothetical protein|nr:ribonuclease H-like domain-containing protein [Treponema sp.]
MGVSNLRDRLRRIKERGMPRDGFPAEGEERAFKAADFSGWESAGCQTLRRQIIVDPLLAFPAEFPPALPVLIPDLGGAFLQPEADGRPVPEDLLFFDLETTGLSGGAGTLAFLAAFGRPLRLSASSRGGSIPQKRGKDRPFEGEDPLSPDCLLTGYKIQLTQYLLLDYPGESDFLNALLGEFAAGGGLVVTYNGKTFDSQILKNRCLMNGLAPPEYAHADLLYPARRLWKRILPNCSQGEIETSVLGLDRSGDIPGALAPDIWFGFLKTGTAPPLLGICEHNKKDILGLAAIFAVLAHIASDPVGTRKRYNYDVENLAFRYRRNSRRCTGGKAAFCEPGELLRTGEELLRLAAEQGYPGALRALAVEAEWRLADFSLALEYTNRALALDALRESLREDFTLRRKRLRGKIDKSAAGK